MFANQRMSFLAVMVLAAAADASGAATAPKPAVPEDVAADHVALSAAQVGSPSVRSAFVTESATQIQASRGDSSVDIRLSMNLRADHPQDENATSTSLALVASAPLAGGGGDTALASLDGLAGGTTIGLQISSLAMHGAQPVTPPNFDAPACKDLLLSRFGTYKLTHPDVKLDELHCDLGTLDDAKAKGLISRAEYRRFAVPFWAPDAGLSSWSLTAKTGYVDSAWYDPVTLAKAKGREDQWSASAQIGYAWLNRSTPIAVVATLSAQSAPKDAASRTACLSTPAPGQPLLTCANGPIGAPARKTTQILSVEGRAVFNTHFAAELQASRDFRNHLSAVHVPMYFIPSDKTGLSGGIVLGWTNQDHKASLGVFVGQSFSVL
jgi:hypothetical protein